MLASTGLACHNKARWQMCEPNGAVCYIDVLAASSARAKRVDLALCQQSLIK